MCGMKRQPAACLRWLAAAAAASLAWLVGCGGSDGPAPGGPPPLGEEPAPLLSATCGGANLAALTAQVYVRSDGSDADGCGSTTANACASIQKGIDTCAAAGCGVLVRHGLYATSTTIELRDGVSVYGGCLFDGEAGRSYRSIVNGPPDQPAVRAASTASATTFQSFVVRAADSNAASGASIAMTVTDSPGLKLSQVRLVAGRGASGRSGGDAFMNPGFACMTQPGPQSSDTVGSFLFLGGAWVWEPSVASQAGLPASGSPGYQGGASIALAVDSAGAIDTSSVLVAGPGGDGGTGGTGTGSAGGGAGGNGGPSIGLAALTGAAASLEVNAAYPGTAGNAGAGGSGGSGNNCNASAGQRGWNSLALASLDYTAIPTWFKVLAPGETLGSNQPFWGANAMLLPQRDGNLCLYGYDGAPVWCSGPGGLPSDEYELSVGSDGYFVFTSPTRLVFALPGVVPGYPGAYLAMDAFHSIAFIKIDGSVAWRAP